MEDAIPPVTEESPNPEPQYQVTVRHLTMIGASVNAALATGRYDGPECSPTMLLRHANEGRLFSTLKRLLGDPQLCDWVWLTQAQREELNEEWSRIGNAYVVEDFRLTRQSSGLALVLGLIFESICMRGTSPIPLDSAEWKADEGADCERGESRRAGDVPVECVNRSRVH